MILRSGLVYKWKAICRKFTVVRNAINIFGKFVFLTRDLLHNSPITTKSCLATKPSTPKQTDMRWCKIASQRCLWEELILVFNSFHEHVSPFLKAFPVAGGQLYYLLVFWRKSWGIVPVSLWSVVMYLSCFQWWQGYFLQQHMLADAFACGNNKKTEQNQVRLGSKQGSIILCLFPGFAESFLPGCKRLPLWQSSATFQLRYHHRNIFFFTQL